MWVPLVNGGGKVHWCRVRQPLPILPSDGEEVFDMAILKLIRITPWNDRTLNTMACHYVVGAGRGFRPLCLRCLSRSFGCISVPVLTVMRDCCDESSRPHYKAAWRRTFGAARPALKYK
jgi:hypothetical protein